jgi:hypothetical protein
MTRRRFVFWIGFGLFSLGEKLRAESFDKLAAAAMRAAPSPALNEPAIPEHWSVGGDEHHTWYQREHYIDGQWWLSGTTKPVDKNTGQRKAEEGQYLGDCLVPQELRAKGPQIQIETTSEHEEIVRGAQVPDGLLRRGHGRPPSRWLRSLNADELRIWLSTIDVPEAGVSGMTFFEHLTRDHSFSADKITGLTESEQAKLHAAAHFGY